MTRHKHLSVPSHDSHKPLPLHRALEFDIGARHKPPLDPPNYGEKPCDYTGHKQAYSAHAILPKGAISTHDPGEFPNDSHKHKRMPECLLDWPISTFSDSVEEVVNKMKNQAKRFLFDNEAYEKLIAISESTNVDIARNRQFAIPPYENMFLQMQASIPDQLGHNFLMGWLIKTYSDYYAVYIAVESKEGNAFVYSFNYNINARWDERTLANRKALEEFGRIYVGHQKADDFSISELIEIGSSAIVVIDNDFKDDEKAIDYIIKTFKETNGVVLMIWAALLLINRPGNHIVLDEQPRITKLHKGKRRVYAAHSTVKINLEPTKKAVRRALGFGARGTPRRHDVRGHFKHYHKVDGCVHVWHEQAAIDDDSRQRWKCEMCGCVRTWTREFMRGDAGIGFVTSNYKVEP